MIKFIEVHLGKQIDRYKLINIDVDSFIDVFLVQDGHKRIKDISKEEYDKDRRFQLEFNVEDKFEVEHYTYKHESRELRNEWNKMVRQLNRENTLDDLIDKL